MTRFRRVALVSVWTVVGRSAGFLIPLAIGYRFGITPATDAFFLSLTVVTYLVMILGETARLAISPHLAERPSPGAAGRLIGSLAACGAVALSVLYPLIVVTICVFGESTGLLSSGMRYPFAVMALAGFPMALFGMWIQHLSAILNLNRKFAATALAPLGRASGVAAVCLLAGESASLLLVAAGWIAGEAIALGLLRRAAGRVGCAVGLNLSGGEAVAGIVRASWLQIAGSAVLYCNAIVDKMVASGLGTGAVSLAHYSTVFYAVMFSAFASPLGYVLVAEWSASRREGETPLPEIARAALKTMFVSVPACLLVYLFRHPVAMLVFGHGRFPDTALPVLADLCFFQSVALIPLLPYTVFSRALIVHKRSRALFVISTVQFLLNLGGDIFLTDRFGVRGLPMATAVHLVFGATAAWFALARRQPVLALPTGGNRPPG